MASERTAAFRLRSNWSANRVLTEIERQLSDSQCALRGHSSCSPEGPSDGGGNTRIELHVEPGRQHLLSPQLTVDVWSDGEGSELSGVFGVPSDGWSPYVAAVSVAGLVALGGLSLAYAQWVVGESPTGLLTLVVAALVLLVTLMAAWAARLAAHEQMREMRGFLEAAVPIGAGPESERKLALKRSA